MVSIDNEHWLNREGQRLAACRAGAQFLSLTLPSGQPKSFGWCHAACAAGGDLAVARKRDPAYLATAWTIAVDLGLERAIDAFAQGEGALQRHFFELFDALCGKLKQLQIVTRSASEYP